MKNKLKYKNEEDRAFGLAGMTISLAAWDALDRIASVSLDAEDAMVTFTGEYYFSTSQAVSAKSSWQELVENFRLTSAMMLSNIFSRCLVLERSNVDREMLKMLYSIVEEEGIDTCGLEKDEINSIFEKTLGYTRRIFGNPRLYPQIRDFAGTLARKRKMTANELRDELHLLQLI